MTLQRAALFLLVLSLLSGCLGGADDPVAPTTTTDDRAPVVVSVFPLPESTGVPTDSPIVVTFSEAMAPASVDGRIGLDDGTVTATSWLDARTLRIDTDGWSAGQRVDLTLDAGITDVSGNALTESWRTGFWTATPRVEVLATQPANGATDADTNTTVRLRFSHEILLESLGDALHVNVGTDHVAPSFTVTAGADDWFVVRFDEPIDASRFVPSRASAQLMVLLETHGIVPVWSQDGTRMTLPLPTPLPAGMPLWIEFDTVTDDAGNVAAEPLVIDLTVDGIAEPWPLRDGLSHTLSVTTYSMGSTGAGIVERLAHRRTERRTSGQVRIATYDDADFQRLVAYESFREVDDVIAQIGFGERVDDTFVETRVGSAIEWFRRPVVEGSRTTVTTASDGRTVLTVETTVEVVGREDLPSRLGPGPRGLLPPELDRRAGDDAAAVQQWIGCWKVVVTTRTLDAEALVSTRVDTIHFAPAIGPVRRVTEVQVPDGEGTRTVRTTEDVIALDMTW